MSLTTSNSRRLSAYHGEKTDSNTTYSNNAPDKLNRSAILLGLTTSVPLLIFNCILGVVISRYLRNQRRKKRMSDDNYIGVSGLDSHLRKFSYDDLRAATDDFNAECELGRGGCGVVYRGKLASTGQKVAVKKWTNITNRGGKEFLSEMSIISRIRHRNIVLLVGWCETKSELLLVYELIPNGSLHSALFVTWSRHVNAAATEFVLSWAHRYKILCEIASALYYLHHGMRQIVIHRDVKSSNVLLGEDFTAILGDFGLARIAEHMKSMVTTQVGGTYGYMAEELLNGDKAGEKSDVFAFGALILETVCGRRASSPDPEYSELSLLEWIEMKTKKEPLLSVVDTKLGGNYDEQQMESVLKLGLQCSHSDPHERPSTHMVYNILTDSSTESISDIVGQKSPESRKQVQTIGRSRSRRISTCDMMSVPV